MKKAIKFFALLLSIIPCSHIAIAADNVGLPSAEQHATIAPPRPEAVQPNMSSAQQTVKNFYAALSQAMQQGAALGFQGRYDVLKPAIEAAFNLPNMTRFAVGPAWYKTAADQQQQLITSFSAFSISNWASRFKKSSGEQFMVIGEKSQPDGSVIVETQLLPKNDKPVTINYMMRKNAEGTWQINDVYLDAAISELASRRAEFGAIIRAKGTDGLLHVLQSKTENMRKSNA